MAISTNKNLYDLTVRFKCTFRNIKKAGKYDISILPYLKFETYRHSDPVGPFPLSRARFLRFTTGARPAESFREQPREFDDTE